MSFFFFALLVRAFVFLFFRSSFWAWNIVTPPRDFGPAVERPTLYAQFPEPRLCTVVLLNEDDGCDWVGRWVMGGCMGGWLVGWVGGFG